VRRWGYGESTAENRIKPIAPEDPKVAARAVRQKRMIVILAAFLIAGGLTVLFALERMPLPMRILVGLTDVFGGLTLLVLVRQKFSRS
jgi:hypothetical protein